jgi:hypothetical protein
LETACILEGVGHLLAGDAEAVLLEPVRDSRNGDGSEDRDHEHDDYELDDRESPLPYLPANHSVNARRCLG